MAIRLLIIVFCGLLIVSCASMSSKEENKFITKDDHAALKGQDVRKVVKKDKPVPQAEFAPSSESLSPLKTRLISLSVSNRPLSEVLQAVAEAASLNLVMQKGVDPSASVNLTINDVAVEEALQIIFSSVDYFYTVEKNILYVKAMDTRIFDFGLPSVIHSYKTELGGDIIGGALSSSASSGSSASASSGGTSGTNNSGITGSVSLKSETDKDSGNMWSMIDTTLKSLLGISQTSTPLTASPAGRPVSGGSAQTAATSTPAQGTSAVRQAQALASEAALSAPQLLPSGATAGSATSALNVPTPSVSINRMSGTIVVTAGKADMLKVEKFLTNLKASLNRQVLIEARIVEVQLKDNLQYGINWNNLNKSLSGHFGRDFSVTATTSGFKDVVSGNASFGLTFSGFDFDSVLNALQTQGDVKVLSNPRLSMINGQSAMLTVGKKKDYIKSVSSQVTTSGSNSYLTYSTEVSSVLSGIMFGIVPYIDEAGNVTLNITPIISDLVELPTQTFGSSSSTTGSAEIGLPVIDVREMSTTVKLRDQEMAVIGGLISQKEKLTDNQVPLLGSIPVLGYLFKSRDSVNEKIELVLMLKINVIM
ncbi:MAG: pilus (MSHA type) biogenesis protein MshL [Nitrospirae bacterium YQR-1]